MGGCARGSSCVLALALLVGAWPADADGRDAGAWLERMARAMHELAYEGTLVYAHDGDLESMEVVHGLIDGEEHERLRALSGKPFELIRSGDRVTCVWPAIRRAMVSRRPENFLPARPPREFASLPPLYTAEVAGTTRVAGHVTQGVRVRPNDAFRYGYRMWLDRDTGLLLRSDMISPAEGVVERFMFTSVKTLEHVDRDRFRRSLDGMDYVEHGDGTSADRIEQPQWYVADLPPGFEAVSHRRKAMPPHGAAVQHSVYSDGLASVSVFIEPADSDAMPLAGGTRMGAVHAYGLKRAGHQVTAVGEVPAITVERIARAVRRR